MQQADILAINLLSVVEREFGDFLASLTITNVTPSRMVHIQFRFKLCHQVIALIQLRNVPGKPGNCKQQLDICKQRPRGFVYVTFRINAPAGEKVDSGEKAASFERLQEMDQSSMFDVHLEQNIHSAIMTDFSLLILRDNIAAAVNEIVVAQSIRGLSSFHMHDISIVYLKQT